MLKTTRYFITAIFILMFIRMFSQDVHFSQFFNSPLSLNPSCTGNFEGDWRISHNYRTQWRAISVPFNTISLGYDRIFYIYSQKFSGGIYFINDRSNDIALTVNKIYLSAGYHKTINFNNLHFGIQPGFVMKNFSTDEITFPNQFDMTSGYYNSGLNSYETGLDQNLAYFDMNLGAGWNKNFGILEPSVAVGLFHVNYPRENFLPEKNRLPMRFSFYGNVMIDATKKFFVKPDILYMRHTTATEFLMGSSFGIKFEVNPLNIKHAYFGTYFRDGLNTKFDAFIGVIGARVFNFDVGVSYDFNISPLKVATSMRGALEISIIYTASSTILQKIAIPCDRY